MSQEAAKVFDISQDDLLRFLSEKKQAENISGVAGTPDYHFDTVYHVINQLSVLIIYFHLILSITLKPPKGLRKDSSYRKFAVKSCDLC